MKSFRPVPIRLGLFRVYYITAGAGDWQIIKVSRPTTRERHKNAPAIISGGGKVVGPGIEWELKPGMMDMDFPDMPAGGEYKYVAGPRGLVMFCSTHLSLHPMKRRKIEEEVQFEVEAGKIAMIISGTAAVSDRICTAPFVINGLEGSKIISPHTLVRGVELSVQLTAN